MKVANKEDKKDAAGSFSPSAAKLVGGNKARHRLSLSLWIFVLQTNPACAEEKELALLISCSNR